MLAQGQHGEWSCQASVKEERQQLLFYSLCPVNVSEKKRAGIAEFLSRANFGIVLGNFEIDFNDGQIRYKTSIDVSGDRLTQALMQQLVYGNVMTMARYLPGIMSVIYSDVSPSDAIAQIES